MYDWIIMPLVNPDGYVYSHTEVKTTQNMSRRITESSAHDLSRIACGGRIAARARQFSTFSATAKALISTGTLPTAGASLTYLGKDKQHSFQSNSMWPGNIWSIHFKLSRRNTSSLSWDIHWWLSLFWGQHHNYHVEKSCLIFVISGGEPGCEECGAGQQTQTGLLPQLPQLRAENNVPLVILRRKGAIKI